MKIKEAARLMEKLSRAKHRDNSSTLEAVAILIIFVGLFFVAPLAF